MQLHSGSDSSDVSNSGESPPISSAASSDDVSVMDHNAPDHDGTTEQERHSGEAPETQRRITRSQTKKAEDALDSNQEDGEDEEEYEVERIVQKRFDKDKNPEYLIKWAGYPEEQNTWEPLQHLTNCQESLDEFEESLKQHEEEPAESATPKRDRDDMDPSNEDDDLSETKKRKI